MKGEFVWHHYENEDELFLGVQGTLIIKLHTGDVMLHAGEFYIVPSGVEHKPVAENEVHVLMFEPKSTVNTGNVDSKKTINELEEI